MAVTWGAIGTSASGTTSCAPSYPSGISAATSKLYCLVTGRSNTASTAPTMPAGWTRIGGLEGGTGTWGVDTGTRRFDVFRKDTVTGSESGTVTVSLSGTTANTLRASIIRVEVGSGNGISEQIGSGADTTHGTGWSVTASAAMNFAAGQLLAVITAQNTDSATQSAQAISASGISFGTRTNRRSNAVTNGNDHRHVIDTMAVSSGSGSVAPTWSHTNSANASGVTGFLLLSETISHALAGDAAAAAEAGGDLPIGKTQEGEAAGAAEADGDLTVEAAGVAQELAGGAAGAAEAAAGLAVDKPLAGDADGAGEAAAGLAVDKALVGPAEATGAVDGELDIGVSLTGAGEAAGEASADISKAVALAAAVRAAGVAEWKTEAGAYRVRWLMPRLSASAQAAGELAVDKELQAAAEAAGDAAADLTANGAPVVDHELQGAAQAAAEAVGELLTPQTVNIEGIAEISGQSIAALMVEQISGSQVYGGGGDKPRSAESTAVAAVAANDDDAEVIELALALLAFRRAA